jgi:uncharacterized protein YoxC
MINVLLALIAILLAVIACFLYRIEKKVSNQFAAFRGELKGYLLDMYAEMTKKSD